MAKTGRPTDYNEKILKKSKEYLKNCKDKFWKKTGGIKKVSLPSIAGLAVFLETRRQNLYEWAKNNEPFSDILERILAEQEKRLIENGLASIYNSNIVKLALGKHGYSDRQEIDNPAQTEAIKSLESIIKEIRK